MELPNIVNLFYKKLNALILTAYIYTKKAMKQIVTIKMKCYQIKIYLTTNKKQHLEI